MIKKKCPKGRNIEQRIMTENGTSSSSKLGQSRLSTETCLDGQKQFIDLSFEDYLKAKNENHQKQPAKEERKRSPRKIIESDLELKFFGLQKQREALIMPLMQQQDMSWISDSQLPLKGFKKRSFIGVQKKPLEKSPLTRRV